MIVETENARCRLNAYIISALDQSHFPPLFQNVFIKKQILSLFKPRPANINERNQTGPVIAEWMEISLFK